MTVTRRGQKSVLDPRELKLQMIVATIWVLGTNLGPSRGAVSALPVEQSLQSQELKLSNAHILLNIFLPKQGKPSFLFLWNLMNLSTGNCTTTFEKKQSRGKDVRTCWGKKGHAEASCEGKACLGKDAPHTSAVHNYQYILEELLQVAEPWPHPPLIRAMSFPNPTPNESKCVLLTDGKRQASSAWWQFCVLRIPTPNPVQAVLPKRITGVSLARHSELSWAIWRPETQIPACWEIYTQSRKWWSTNSLTNQRINFKATAFEFWFKTKEIRLSLRQSGRSHSSLQGHRFAKPRKERGKNKPWNVTIDSSVGGDLFRLIAPRSLIERTSFRRAESTSIFRTDQRVCWWAQGEMEGHKEQEEELRGYPFFLIREMQRVRIVFPSSHGSLGFTT